MAETHRHAGEVLKFLHKPILVPHAMKDHLTSQYQHSFSSLEQRRQTSAEGHIGEILAFQITPSDKTTYFC